MQDELHVEVASEAKSETKLDVKERGHEAVVDEPESFGGEDEGPNPLEYMFTGLAGCMNVTIHHIAMEEGIEVEELRIDVKGDIDLEKFMEGSGDRAGFQEIKVEVDIETDSTEEKEEELLKSAEQRCPVSDNIQNQTEIKVEAD